MSIVPIPRLCKDNLLKKLEQFPAVALVGSRQSGKTTLAKELSPHYYDLELASDQLRTDIEWEIIRSSRKLVIFDEAQTWPELFPRLRSAIDTDRKRNGRFLLLGSVSPVLMREVSESLAGRLGLIELGPLFLSELAPKKTEALWLNGGYPDGGILQGGAFPAWQRDYLALLAARDLPNWGLSAKPKTTERLFHMLAALHGSVWNASQVGKSLGLNYHTVNTYLDYLESAFLIRRLPAYFKNIKKRIIKSPKLYWRDSGLLHALLGISTMRDLLQQPRVGFSWEGWVLEQILAFLNSRGAPYEAFYLRTQTGDELDLILRYQGSLWAFEVKFSTYPEPKDRIHLSHLADLIGADKRVLLSRSQETFESNSILATNLQGFLQAL